MVVVPRKKRERDFYSRHHRRHVPPQFEIFAKRKFTFRPISNVVAAKVVTRILPFDIIPFVDFSEAENDFLFFFFSFRVSKNNSFDRIRVARRDVRFTLLVEALV